ncbi:MAG TPA: polysaccharide biosynthesis/export family protein [Bryobacteraceae bacterium]|nr:polysaccharide biosynthesis/export family protein [Bryobacteraceae bacterium]
MRLTLFLLGCGFAFAQGRPPGVVDSNVAAVANLPAQRIAGNDLIAVSVYDAPELTRTVRVGEDGTIRLPMLKERIRADGLLPGALENAIADALSSEQILVDPIVTVTILEYHSRPISVVGAVHKPVTFQAVGKVTLLDALVMAEGVTSDAGPALLLMRPQPADGDAPAPAVESIPLQALLAARDPKLNVALTGGEEIRVPEARMIYVVGNVKKPGAFPVRDGSETTVLKLLALAEGLVPFAGHRAYIFRPAADAAERQEIPIELDRILERKSADVALQADDILYIPDNKGRRRTAEIIDRVSSFGTATASGLLIWH